MPSQNLLTLERIYDGWKRGDFTIGVAAYDPNAALVLDPELPESGVHVGLEEIRSYMRRLLEAWDSFTIKAESFHEAGDSVLVEIEQTGTGRDSGAAVSLRYFQLWTFRGGRVIRIESVVREATALEALGLRERPPASGPQGDD